MPQQTAKHSRMTAEALLVRRNFKKISQCFLSDPRKAFQLLAGGIKATIRPLGTAMSLSLPRLERLPALGLWELLGQAPLVVLLRLVVLGDWGQARLALAALELLPEALALEQEQEA